MYAFWTESGKNATKFFVIARTRLRHFREFPDAAHQTGLTADLEYQESFHTFGKLKIVP